MTTKTEAWWVGVDRETFYQRLRERQPDMQKAKDIYITAKVMWVQHTNSCIGRRRNDADR